MSNIVKVCASTGTTTTSTATTEELTEIQSQQKTATELELERLRAELAVSDVYMARMCEDLIDILVANGTIALTDFAQAAQDKLAERAQLRADIAALES
jgi:hypothetical protein